MKILLPLVISVLFFTISSHAQNKPSDKENGDTSAILNLPGDNLDLYAVLDLFQKSKTIEAFEKSLNDDKSKINNLDLDLNKKVDFIKVTTQKEGDSYRFILQVDVSKEETQDVAVILLDKDKKGKVSMQIVGDEELYGKDYVIEPKGNSSVTANPGYTGTDPVKENVTPTQTQTVVVQSAPIVQYVYSPAYVPYYPPYYYGFYPPWFGFATVMAVGIYRHNHYYHHHGYYGGHYHGGGNTVIINNRNSINHYNNTRNRSTTVSDNMNRGNYGNRTNTGNRGGASASTRPSTGTSNRPTTSDRSRPSTGASNLPSTSDRMSPSSSNRSSSMQSRPSTTPSTRSSYSGGGRTMSSGSGFRGGGGGGRRR